MPVDQTQIVNIILSTLGVIFIAFISIGIIKKLKFGTFTKNNPIKILFQYPITNKDKLLLVEVKNKEILVGLSSSGFRSLGEINGSYEGSKDEEFLNTLSETIKDNNKKNINKQSINNKTFVKAKAKVNINSNKKRKKGKFNKKFITKRN